MFNSGRISAGFTLVELVIVIALLGIVGAGTAKFIRSASDIYVDVTERDSLLRSASFAVERFTREISSAVPNSVRLSGDANTHCIEFVPVNWSAFYLSLPIVGEPSPTVDIVKMTDIDDQVYTPDADDFAMVYPLNATHVYDANANRRQMILGCSDDGDGDCSTDDDIDSVVRLEVSEGFALSSPTSRLYIADNAISYCTRNNALYRHVSGLSSDQILYTSGGQLMAEGISNDLSSNPSATPALTDPFQVVGATLTRNAYVRANFLFTRSDEQMSIVKEVHIPNVP
ncbi:type II secretion system protein [Agaribacter marinus]|uniref:MSHA biogenesis protein MshO n=1 Tax=Agaribacter marinus TaxID=1431249 RepID=A0AA37WJH8_9ALTE|nr:type II secretion system protein [Agaribacter marinus]GLR72243.1 MSHA biogenesis protein MshO [Agaribacter marinus]